MANFDEEHLKKALAPEEFEFYRTIRIKHNDHSSWAKLMNLQQKVADYQNDPR